MHNTVCHKDYINKINERYRNTAYNDIIMMNNDIKNDIDKHYDDGGQTILHYATNWNFTNIIKYLIDRGADVGNPDMADNTPLDNVINNGNIEILDYLFNMGMDVNVEITYYGTLLNAALLSNNINMLKFLIEKGVDVKIRHENQRGPIFLAKSREATRLLLENGANMHESDWNKSTVLHNHINNAYYETAIYLIEKGFDVNVRDKDGYTPLLLHTLTNENDNEQSMEQSME